MTIYFQTWRWFTRAASVLAIPAVAVLLIEPGGWVEIAAYAFVLTVGASGGVVAILRRTGALRFRYTDADRRSFEYRLFQASGFDLGGPDDNAA